MNSVTNQVLNKSFLAPKDAWDSLSISEKAEMMKAAIRNGIYNLHDIRQKYNEFAEGGSTDWSFDGWKRQIAEYKGLDVDKDNTYDYEGYFNKYPEEAWKMLKDDPKAHFTDEFKTVYHPTFSTGSMYSGVRHPVYNPNGLKGGAWSPDNTRFTMSPDGYRGPVSMDDRKWYLENAEDNGVQLREADGSLPIYDGIPWGGVLPNVTVVGNKHSKGGNLYAGESTDNDLIDWIIREEGFNKKPEDIGDGKMTLGSGLTAKKWHDLYRKRGNKWSAEDNRMAVAEEVANRRRWAEKNIPNWSSLPDSAQKALLSYKYNYDFNATNSPKLFQALRDSNLYEAARQMDATSKNPKFKEGLMQRRKREQDWFLSEVNTASSKPVTYNNSSVTYNSPIVVAEPTNSTTVYNPYKQQAENTYRLPIQVPDSNRYVTTHTVSPEEQRRQNLKAAIDSRIKFDNLMSTLSPQNNPTPNFFSTNTFGKGGKKPQKNAGNANSQKAMQFFMNKGLSQAQAAGLVGNLMRESGMQATAVNPGSKAYGLAQWLGPRKKALFAKYGNSPTLDQQLDFVWHELNTTHKNGLKHLKASKTAEEAARNVMGYYEFSAGPEAAIAAMNKSKQDGYGSMQKGVQNAARLVGVPVSQYQQPTVQMTYEQPIQEPFYFEPSNPEAFFRPLEYYNQPIELDEEQSTVVPDNPYSEEQLKRQEQKERLDTLGWLLSMNNQRGQNSSLLSTIGMLSGSFANGGPIVRAGLAHYYDGATESSQQMNRPVTTGGAGYIPTNFGQDAIDYVTRNLYDNLTPSEYADWNAGLNTGGKWVERAVKAAVGIPDTYMKVARQNGNSGYDKERDDIFATYLSIPRNRRHKIKGKYTISKSQYRPTIGTDSVDYYRINELDRNPYDMPKEWGTPTYEDILINQATQPQYAKGQLIDEPLKLNENRVVAALNAFLGPHTIGRGYDNKGEYVSYYDKWDINPVHEINSQKQLSGVGLENLDDISMGIGKPVHIYDRIYLDDYYGVPNEFRGGHYLPEVTVYSKKKKTLGGHLYRASQ